MIMHVAMKNGTARTCRAKNDISKRTHGRKDPEKSRGYVTRCEFRVYVTRPPVSGRADPLSASERTHRRVFCMNPAGAGRAARVPGATASAIKRGRYHPDSPLFDRNRRLRLVQ